MSYSVLDMAGMSYSVLDMAGMSYRVLDMAGMSYRVLDTVGISYRVLDTAGMSYRVLDMAGMSCRVLDMAGISSDKQFPMSRPEFLLYIHPHEHRRESHLPYLSTEVVENRVDLKISSAAVSDSVLYYCALRPTVTGNPDTLYRTSLSVFITELLTLVQILHWRSSCRHF
ncbi:hypothetical protein NFI96_029655, partial [Prochilodus magdalenae]